ncbi:hypothetical protein BGZ65_006272, partial [Modicella reniformis]
ELVEEIGGYIEQDELARCARVCKSWYGAFIPQLYRHVRYDNHSCKMVALWTATQKHSRHMRSLAVIANDFPELALLGPECCHLTTLSLVPLAFVNQQWCSWLRALIDLNPSIHTLYILLNEQLDRMLFHGEHNILKQMSALRNLSVLNDHYPKDRTKSSGVFEAILECGSQLESLTYEVVRSRPIPEAEPMEASLDIVHRQPWTKLVSLNIHDQDGRREIELLSHCPNLWLYKTRVDCRRNGYESLHLLAQNYTSGDPLYRLEHLEIMQMQGPKTAAALDELLQVCAGPSGLKTFYAVDSIASQITIKTLLTYHAKTLETVVMSSAPWPSPGDLHLLLTMCPRLRHLETFVWSEEPKKPWLHDLMKSPWICTDLRILHLITRQKNESPLIEASQVELLSGQEDVLASLQRQFWNRIGALKNLSTLHLNTESRLRIFPTPLSIIPEDIEQLCGLNHLQEFQIPPWQEFMSPAVKEELQLKRPDLQIEYIDEMQLLA